jgi:two-component system sensor histidine kinase YcbA
MKKTALDYTLLAVLIAIASEIHFYPLNSGFRISLGIIIINTIGLVREDVEPFPLIFYTGLIIFFERLFTSMVFLKIPYEIAFLNSMPSLIYYVVFGILFSICSVYKYRDDFFRTLILLILIDSFSNSLEAFIRGDFSSQTLMVVVVVAVIRALTAYAIFTLWRRKELIIIRQEHQKRYSQLNMLVANVEAELFYLKKSSGDIEAVMRKCYDLYHQAPMDTKEKQELLDISKDIHEIKKDYVRVLSGFQDFVDHIQDLEYLTVNEIFDIMKINYDKVTKNLSQTIDIIYEREGNPKVKSYLSIFTILNNLIDNSIAACNKGGTIHVSYREDALKHYFTVIDNGCGMSNQVQNLIFNPGFTTKYDGVTGKSSTGIGLTHVKNTVESLGGSICVESIEGTGSKFTLEVAREIGSGDTYE